MADPVRVVGVPTFWASVEEQLRKVSLAINGMLTGKANNGFEVTLTANGTSTNFRFATRPLESTSKARSGSIQAS